MKKWLIVLGMILIVIALSSSATAATYLKPDFSYHTSGRTAWFTDESVGLNIVEWYWTFGDDNHSDEQDPVHTFPGYGKYNITLTVTNSYGEIQSVAKNIELVRTPAGPYDSVTFLVPVILVVVGIITAAVVRDPYARVGAVVVIIGGLYFVVTSL